MQIDLGMPCVVTRVSPRQLILLEVDGAFVWPSECVVRAPTPQQVLLELKRVAQQLHSAETLDTHHMLVTLRGPTAFPYMYGVEIEDPNKGFFYTLVSCTWAPKSARVLPMHEILTRNLGQLETHNERA